MISVLPLDIGICLFRVLQEALHNAVKHSGTKRIEVQLKEDSNEVSLIIHDSGKGFDVTAAMQGHGLGLTSMKERVRLVNGTITIHSNGRDGTQSMLPFLSAQVTIRRERPDKWAMEPVSRGRIESHYPSQIRACIDCLEAVALHQSGWLKARSAA